MSYGEDDAKRRKRFILIGVSSFLLVAMVAAVTLGVTLKIHDDKDLTSSVKAIKQICAPTDYKKTCEDSLMKNAGTETDPKELVRIAFNVTIANIREAMAKSTTLRALQSDPRSKQALDQCSELMEYAIDELKSSFEELGKLDITKIDEALINLRIWLSAALSHEKTCLEGFEATKGDAGDKMRKALNTAMALTHNGLAMVGEISGFLEHLDIDGISNRKLLEDVNGGGSLEDMPMWVNDATRKLLSVPASKIKADRIVAQDGSGQFRTINEALKDFPKHNNKTFVIYIKEGFYQEFVQINKSMTHLMMIGDGADKTRILGSIGFTDGITTYRTTPFAAVGDHFIAKNMAFENAAGAIKHQAVAARVHSDMSVFYNCTFDGYQDTLYAHSHRQFYRDCTISGTIDFLFGDAAAVFQNCTLVVRKPLPNQQCLVTANGRIDGRETTGYVFQGCRITGTPEYLEVASVNKAYLGRPWKLHSRTIFINTYIPAFIQPQGWLPWNLDFALDTLFYAEYKNRGPGADVSQRVKWAGIKNLTENEALGFTAGRFIQGDSWIRAARVPYTSGMLGKKVKKVKVVS